jgi:hypothetical protein
MSHMSRTRTEEHLPSVNGGEQDCRVQNVDFPGFDESLVQDLVPVPVLLTYFTLCHEICTSSEFAKTPSSPKEDEI